jgi:hypothetical protein
VSDGQTAFITTGERLNRLEEENRRRKRGCRFAQWGLGSLIVLLMLFYEGQGTRQKGSDIPSLAQGSDGFLRRLTVEELTVIDSRGNSRVIFGTNPDGTAGQWSYDQEGKNRVCVLISPDGTAGQYFFDKDGKNRVTVFTSPDGMAGQQILDKDGKKRVVAGTKPDGTALQQLLDPAEKVRVTVAAFPDGNVGQVFFDQYGNIQAPVPP